MAASRHRTRPLHNFDLPELRWANQRLLRCMKLPSSTPDHRRRSSHSADDIDAIREKLMLDLRAAADQMKVSMLPEDAGNLNSPPPPWNLRTRRAACEAPMVDSRSSPQKAAEKSSRSKAVEKPVKLSVPLTKAEIEEDFRAMVGIRPPRRPKKRPKTVQGELDQLFPGLRLKEVTPEMYKVDDVAE